MSDTPRTDAETYDAIAGCTRCNSDNPHSFVPASLARKLERENAALLKRLEATDQWDDYNCIKSLQRENAALRAALEAMVSANDGVAVYPTPEAKAQNAALKLAKAALDAARKEQP